VVAFDLGHPLAEFIVEPCRPPFGQERATRRGPDDETTAIHMAIHVLPP